MRDYHKYLQPFWIQQEAAIEAKVPTDMVSWDYLHNREIAHGMVNASYAHTVATQTMHLQNWERVTGLAIQSMSSVCEWGGGIGGMCHLVRGISDAPYTIIDIPVIHRVQRYTLRATKNVNYFGIDRLDTEWQTLSPELFISVYALSESSPAAVAKVMECNFFGAKHLLLGFYNTDVGGFKFADSIPALARGAELVQMDPTSSYIIK
jgi:hypothetical protein